MSYFYNGSSDLLEKLTSKISKPCLALMKNLSSSPQEFEIIDSNDCKQCIYSRVDWSCIPPLSESLILEFSRIEIEYLKMADRLGIMQSYQKRKDDFDKHLRFWHWKLSKYRISYAVFENIPHEGYNFVVYHILLKLNIGVITFFQLPIRPKKTYLMQVLYNIQDHGCELKKIISSNENKSDRFKSDSKFLKKFSGYFDIMNEDPISIKSFTRVDNNHKKNLMQSIYASMNKLKSIILSKFLIIRRHSLSDLYLLIGVKLKLNSYFSSHKVMSRYYDRYSSAPSLDLPYIYFPLHYQPELSTSPLGGVFVNQHHAVEIVASAAKKKGILVYVKEHPRRSKAVGTRAFDFYEKLLKYENVIFLNGTTSTYDLVDNSIFVATITGSVGWEACLRQKPVLMFGNRFYEAFQSVFSVRSEKDVTEALNFVLNNDLNITKSQIMTFLNALDQVTIEAFNYKKDEEFATVSYSQSIDNKVEAIINSISKEKYLEYK